MISLWKHVDKISCPELDYLSISKSSSNESSIQLESFRIVASNNNSFFLNNTSSTTSPSSFTTIMPTNQTSNSSLFDVDAKAGLNTINRCLLNGNDVLNYLSMDEVNTKIFFSFKLISFIF